MPNVHKADGQDYQRVAGSVDIKWDYILDVSQDNNGNRSGTLQFHIHGRNGCVTNQHSAIGDIWIAVPGKGNIFHDDCETSKMDPAPLIGPQHEADGGFSVPLAQPVVDLIYAAGAANVSVQVRANDTVCI